MKPLNPSAVTLQRRATAPIITALRGGDTLLPILMFHNVDSSHEEYLTHIVNRGFESVTLDDALAFTRTGKKANGDTFPTKPIVITYDDGYASTYTIAYPALASLGLTATCYVISEWIGYTSGPASDVGVQHVGSTYRPFTWAQADEMYTSGVMDIQCHTQYQYNATERTDEQWIDDVANCITEIETQIATHSGVTHFCWPQGVSSDSKRTVLENAGIVTAVEVEDFTTEQFILNHKYSNPLRLQRVPSHTIALDDGVLFDLDPRTPLNNNWAFQTEPGGITSDASLDWLKSGTGTITYPNDGVDGKRAAELACTGGQTVYLNSSQMRRPNMYLQRFAVTARYKRDFSSGTLRFYLKAYDYQGNELSSSTLATLSAATDASWSSTYPMQAQISGFNPAVSYVQVRAGLEGGEGTVLVDELAVRPMYSALAYSEYDE